jgi:hypothetical protein
MNPRRVVEVAGEQALLTDERYTGYRAEVVRSLVQVIAAQAEGLSERGRREKIGKVVEALGIKVASETRRTP